MDLPEEARKMGAMARWVGYVGVEDVDVAADRIKRLGGTVYVPRRIPISAAFPSSPIRKPRRWRW